MRIYITKIARYYKYVVTSKLITQGAPTVIRKESFTMIETATLQNAFPPDTESAEDVLTAPASFGSGFPTGFSFEEEPRKGKKKKGKKGKKGKKARKKAAKRARKHAMELRIAQANYKCGYLAAENDMLRKMIALSVGVKRGTFNDRLAENGLKLLPRGDR